MTFAHIHLNDAGRYQVTYADDNRLLGAAADLGVMAKVYDTHLEASRDAHKVVALVLDIEWARSDAEETVRRRHGVKE